MPDNPSWRVVGASVNADHEAAAISALADAAEAGDGVAALSEHSLLHLTRDGSRHLTVHDDSALVGYAQVWDDGASELVVDPPRRRAGVGSALWRAARQAGADRAWAHGDLLPAAGIAAAEGLIRVRELHQMSRALTAADAGDPGLPDWVEVATYADRPDPGEWVALNAAAFASHPEQGRLTAADFQARTQEPWFDPAGLLYLLDRTTGPDHPPIAFHWTKVPPEAGTGWAPGPGPRGAGAGEVYAVGVDPAYQGRGLAGPLTRLGLAHLAGRGVGSVELYVDGDNERALRTYRREGFGSARVDVVYAVEGGHPVAEPVRMEA